MTSTTSGPRDPNYLPENAVAPNGCTMGLRWIDRSTTFLQLHMASVELFERICGIVHRWG